MAEVPMNADTLYDICLFNIAEALKNCGDDYGIRSDISNPFSELPSCLVNDLAEAVVELSDDELKVEHLFYLITSGKLEHLKLINCFIDGEEVITILNLMQCKSQHLRTLILRIRYFENTYNQDLEFRQAQALQSLIENSPQLEVLESRVSFELIALRYCRKLKVLKLSDALKRLMNRPLCDLTQPLEIEDSKIWHEFKFLHHISFCSLMPVLSLCTELTFVDTDISQALEYLHRNELIQNRINKKYKLEKCYLRQSLSDETAANYIVVKIASLAIPNLKELFINVSNYNTIHVLSNFSRLQLLSINWAPENKGDFQLGLLAFLKNVGVNLRRLLITNFSKVDFAVIVAFCPNIEQLNVSECSELNCYEYPSIDLKYLSLFQLREVTNQEGKSSFEAWVSFLSHCSNLTRLDVTTDESFNDGILKKMVRKSSFSHLTELMLSDTGLTQDGISMLLCHMKSIKYLILDSIHLDSDIIADIIYDINPSVKYISSHAPDDK